MLTHQKALFTIEESITYLNGSYMSPQLKEVSRIGFEQLVKKENPQQLGVDDFFEPRKVLKQKFANLIEAADYRSIAIIPSVSYGIANAANNIPIEKGDEIVVCEAQFPSHIYAWQEIANTNGGTIVEVKAPPLIQNRASTWNERILDAINSKTKAVAISQAHWADGTLFDLLAIRKRSNEVGAKLIIDGTQSVGAFPFSVKEIQPDALICAGYKWLMGPYGMGVAYYAESFWDGIPIEHNWINRYKSEDFANLVNYQSGFQPGAERFSVGESSNFILLHMLSAAIEQTMQWGAENIQEYCRSMIGDRMNVLRSRGCFVESEDGRGNHLFGVYLPDHLDKDMIKKRLQDKGVFVSYRGNAIRVSPHVYNEEADFELFVDCIR